VNEGPGSGGEAHGSTGTKNGRAESTRCGDESRAGSLGLHEVQPLGGSGAGGTGAGDVPAITLSPRQVAAEIERIVGSSFTTPFARDACEKDLDSNEATPFIDALTLTFEKGVGGELVVVSSLPAAARLRVARSVAVPEGSSFRVRMPFATAGCFVYYFEEENKLVWAEPRDVHLEFEGALGNRPPRQVTLTAEYGPGDGGAGPASTASAVATPDERAPRLRDLSSLERHGASDLYVYWEQPGWQLPRHFEFDELLAPGWSVKLADDEGHSFDVAEWAPDRGDDVGVDVNRFFPAGFHWVIDAHDLAGNRAEGALEYAVPPVEPLDGSFESELGYTPRWDDGEILTRPWGAPNVRAIAGEHSFYSDSGILTPKRVVRASGAKTLRLSARLLQPSAWPGASLQVRVRPLEAGAGATWQVTEVAGWEQDAAASTTGLWVSAVRDISVPLPSGDADTLIEIGSEAHLWLDSLRTE